MKKTCITIAVMKQKSKKHRPLFTSFLVCFSMTLLLAAGTVFEKADAMKETWTVYDGSLRFIDRSGNFVRGRWLADGGDLYYMKEDGTLTVGRAVIDGRTYYFDQSGRIARGWFTDSGKRCYVRNGKLLTGWQRIDETTYYFDENGFMQTGWLEMEEGTYYLMKDGRLASGWIRDGGRDYWIDEKGMRRKKSWRSGDELFILDPYMNYARLDLAEESAKISEISGQDLQCFGSVEIAADKMEAIRTAAEELCEDGHHVGFVVWIPSLGGISLNQSRVFYSASTIKGPYVTSLWLNQPSSYEEYSGWYQDTIFYSDNFSYSALYERYGTEELKKAALMVNVSPDLFADYYADLTPADLARLWLFNYAVINDLDFPSDLKDCFAETETSVIRQCAGGLKTQTKAGWLDQEDGMSAHDAGVVFTENGPYIIAVMSDHPGDPAVLKELITALHEAVLSLQ